MAVTSNTYTVGGSGQAGPYSYSFPILADTDVKVSVNAVVKTVTTHYTLDSVNTRITFVSGQEPSTGDKVIVYRDTDEDPIKSVFSSGSTLRSTELNDNFNQLLYIAQETEDQAMSTLGGTMQANFTLGKSSDLVFEGDTDDAYETTLTVADPTADRTITLPNVTGTVVTTGDTSSVSGTMIANDAINRDKIADDSVGTSELLANAVTASELANDAVETAKIADDAVTGAKIADDSINSEHYVDGSIDTAHIADSQVTTAKVADDAITTAKMAAGSITATEIADNAVTHGKMADSSVGTAELRTGEVTNAKLGADSVDGSKIADDAIGAEHIQANAVGTSEIADAELVTLAGMPSATASILADSTALTSTTAELNLLDGKSVVTSVSGSSTDVQLPTAKAVNDQIVSLLNDAGGFVPINDELKFPNANPDPDDGAGTIVSIADAGGIVVNGSGVSTTGRTLGGTTVTINGIDSSLNNSTIAAGKGMLVQTTSTLNTYDYHRLVVDEAGVAATQTLVNDFNDRYRVNAGEPTTSLNEGDLVYDTNADKMKVYDSTTSAWKEVTSTGDFKYLFLCPAGGSGAPTLNGSIATYDLREGSNSGAAASVTNAAQLIVSINGVIQKANTGTSAPSEGFALVDANTIIFGTNLPAGANVFIHQAGSAVSIPVPGDNTVSTAKIQNLAVTTGKIADQAVDLTKLPHGDGSSNGKYLRSNNGADPTWETISQYSTPLTTRGDLLYRDASGDQRLAKGTAGQYLKIGANDPEWADVVGAVADGCIFENDQTISNNYTIASGKGAHSVGPITVNATVTVNGNWVVS